MWSDTDRARLAVNSEASALRAVVLLANAFPEDVRDHFRAIVARHIDEAVREEWPAMAHQQVPLKMVSTPLAEGLRLAFNLKPEGPGQMAAQREIIASLETAVDARRQRIIVSASTLDWVRWSGLILQAFITMVTIALVHSDNRTASALALGLFASAAGLALLLIASHTRPFAGAVPVQPGVLPQVMPEDTGGTR